MKRLFTLVCLLTGITTQLFAQYAVQGMVVEEAQQPVLFATVALQALPDSSIIKGAMTDEKGAFVIPMATEGTYFISVQTLGYQKKYSAAFTLSASRPVIDLGKIALEESVHQLAEVTVQAQRPLIEQKSDRFVLNVENSILTKGNKVNDLLKYAPLVRTSAEGDVTSVANKSNVLILVDGRQMGKEALDLFLKNFSAEDILRVEVITNPSARYDASFGAVIQIFTRKSLEKGFNGRAAVNYSQGSYGRFASDVSWNYRSEKWNVFGNVSGGRSDWYSDQTIERFFTGGAMGNTLTNLRGTQSLATFWGIDFTPRAGHTLGVRLSGNTGRSNGHMYTRTSFLNPESNVDSLLHTHNRSQGKNYTYDLNVNYTGKLDTLGRELTINVTQTVSDYHSSQHIDYRKTLVEGAALGEPNLLRINSDGQPGSFIAQADLGWPVNNARWEWGTKYIFVKNDNEVRQEHFIDNQYQIDPAFSSAGRYREHTYAAYSSYSRNIKGWNVQAGLRAEQTDQQLIEQQITRSYFGLFPSLGLSRSFKSGYAWGITYSRKVARPSLADLVPYRYLTDPYTFMAGNPSIKPQFTHSLDTYLSKGNLTFFANYAYARDLISMIITADPATNIYTQFTGNLDQVHQGYAGLSWSSNLNKWWQTNTNATLSGVYTDSPVADVPSLRKGGFGWEVSSTNLFSLPRSWRAELSFTYNSPTRSMLWDLGSVFAMSAGVQRDVLKRGNLRISVQDIFRSQVYRVNIAYGGIRVNSRDYGDAQRVRVSFSYNFGKQTVRAARQRALGNETEKGRMSR